MNKIITICILIIFVFLLSGSSSCSTLGKETKSNKPKEIIDDPILEIVSKPPGAVIEIDNIYMGETPLKIPTSNKTIMNACKLYLKEGNEFNTMLIVATPKNEGYTQLKRISCTQIYSGVKIYFDMRLGPVNK